MPTYTNDSTETKIVEDINGVLQHVLPEGSIATYQILGTGWTETAATPLYPEVVLPFPVDYRGAVIPLPSRVTVVSSFESTGVFQELTLPCAAKSVLIQVHNGVVDDFTSFAVDPPVFHFSTTGHATNKDYIVCVGSVQFDIVTEATVRIGYVRAAEAQYISVMVVA